METLEPLLGGHRFFHGLEPAHLSLLVGCAANVRFGAGAFLFREGEPAGRFFMVRDGKVALQIASPNRSPVTVQTVPAGGVVGFSWLFEPHLWQFDGLAIEPVRAIAVDGTCLRGKCEQDTGLGYDLMRRFARIAVERLQAARLQVLDVYGHAGAG